MNPEKTIRRWRLGRGFLGVVALVLGGIYGVAVLAGIVRGTTDLVGRQLVYAFMFVGALVTGGIVGILRGFQFSCRACGTPLTEVKAKVTALRLTPLWTSLGAQRVDPPIAGAAFESTSGENIVLYDYCGKCFAYGRLAATTPRAETRAIELEGIACRQMATATVEARVRGLQRK